MMVRRMKESDTGSAAEVERLCFSDPWTDVMIAEGLSGALDQFWVLEEEEHICGYCCMRSIAGEGEILRIAVLPKFRGRGYGKKLMETMVGFASSNGLKALTLEVRESNSHAINLYKTYGFETEAVRKEYYRNPKEDALLMWKRSI